jgi:pimeloyl-ACP methyl ester carboxylesterase
VLLLHGLARYAGEWAETAGWLTTRHRVVAPEQRGHGRSGSCPGARLAEIADCGHDLHLERPERWRDTLQRFLQTFAPGSPAEPGDA